MFLRAFSRIDVYPASLVGFYCGWFDEEFFGCRFDRRSIVVRL